MFFMKPNKLYTQHLLLGFVKSTQPNLYTSLWPQITSENIKQLTDIDGYCNEFYRLFGFHAKNVNYDADVDADVKIESID